MLSERPIELRVGTGTLYCVPAVHFRLAFAQRVNELCRELRPAAVAVELGPATAAAALAWLGELGVGAGPQGIRDLPCMLALMKQNRRIRSSKRDIALRLQETTGRDLQELPPELLKELLGFSAVRVLYLSPVDSIIEALRCGLELQVPVYGVDLEETADRQPHEKQLQDPTQAWQRVEDYTRFNRRFADDHRDDEIDDRRERVMAARLKRLLAEHRSVLFTCGLAHWLRLEQLLRDEQFPPAPALPAVGSAGEGFRRLVVHPSLAAQQLDLFPAFADGYRQLRMPADRPRKFDNMPAPADMLAQSLQEAYRRHFAPAGEASLDSLAQDLDSRRQFEQFLSSLCAVKQLQVPDMFTTLCAAQGTMSDAFARTLASVLMEFDWASPKQFPDLSTLAPVPDKLPGCAELIDAEGKHGKHFYIDPLPGGGYRVQTPIPWNWDEVADDKVPPTGELRTWVPLDYLRTALSLRASDVARQERDRFRVGVFEGSLLNGVDLKNTLRATIRGDERIYVREEPRPIKRKATDGDGFPVVWLFTTEPRSPSYDFRLTGEYYDNIQSMALDRKLLQEVSASRAMRDMTAAIEFSQRSPAAHGFTQIDLAGILLYCPSFFESLQFVRWAERGGYRRNPFVGLYFSSLQRLFGQEGDIVRAAFKPRELDWPTALILMALPFAAGSMTVVAPDRFTPSRLVEQHAARYRVKIHYAPLSFFPREQVERISRDFLVPALPDGDGNEYADGVDRAMQRDFRETALSYRNLLPPKWLNYGKETDGKATERRRP